MRFHDRRVLFAEAENRKKALDDARLLEAATAPWHRA
jgi:hypothetical protein